MVKGWTDVTVTVDDGARVAARRGTVSDLEARCFQPRQELAGKRRCHRREDAMTQVFDRDVGVLAHGEDSVPLTARVPLLDRDRSGLGRREGEKECGQGQGQRCFNHGDEGDDGVCWL